MQTYNQRENAGLVSLVGLGLVVAAAILTVWWWSHAVWGDFSLSFLEQVAPYLGYARPAPVPDVGYKPGAASATPNTAGSVIASPSAAETAPPTAAAGPYCASGQPATFVLGFAQLHDTLGDAVMGEPVECEHANAANGDTLQQTTTGLAMYRPSTGELSFTDGWRYWALTPAGTVAREGDDQMPAQPQPAPNGEQARVAHTDGVGVVLRSSPSMDARQPRGLLEGQQVTILARSGSDWVRVQAVDASHQEGWVPNSYLEPVN